MRPPNKHAGQQEKMTGATCLNCHYTDETFGVLDACPKCGTIGGVLNAIKVAGVEILPSVDLKVRNPRYQGRRKYIREVKSIAEYSVDGRLVRKDRLIDRGNNRYREKVTVVDTGDVIRNADHKLTEHTRHGSDKPGQRHKDQ